MTSDGTCPRTGTGAPATAGLVELDRAPGPRQLASLQPRHEGIHRTEHRPHDQLKPVRSVATVRHDRHHGNDHQQRTEHSHPVSKPAHFSALFSAFHDRDQRSAALQSQRGQVGVDHTAPSVSPIDPKPVPPRETTRRGSPLLPPDARKPAPLHTSPCCAC